MKNGWRVVVPLDDGITQDEAEAFARGVSRRLGHTTDLLRVDHGDEIHVSTFKAGRVEKEKA